VVFRGILIKFGDIFGFIRELYPHD